MCLDIYKHITYIIIYSIFGLAIYIDLKNKLIQNIKYEKFSCAIV